MTESSPLTTVTFLCTDIEDSTRLWEQHTEAMRAALARHDAILQEAVEAHGGTIFKRTGDGALATLPAPAQAVGAASAALRALARERWGATGPLAVRIGIHDGNVEVRGGDYFGPVINRAHRIMAAGHGGQILLSGASAASAREALGPGLGLVDLGLHRLRGLSEPEHIFQLTVDGLRADFPPLQSLEAFPVVTRLAELSFAPADEDLAGRITELDVLEQAWGDATRGNGRVVLIGGEPGIGKTRLVREMARRVHASEAPVLYGRCDEEAIVPFQPFVEALRPVVASVPPSTLRERLHGLERDLSRLFPELLGPYGTDAAAVSDGEAERYRLFEAVTSLVTGVAASARTLLILDDVHWANKATLMLLRHVVRATTRSSLLIVACYRDVEVAFEEELARLLADLRREPYTAQISLRGLSEEESGGLLRTIAGRQVPAPLVGALHRETGGSPLFLAELLRSLIEANPRLLSGGPEADSLDLGELTLPETVRDVIARRVERLTTEVQDVLRAGAVAGPEFSVLLVADATGAAPDTVFDGFDRARAAGLVTENPGRPGTYSFTHELIRQTIYTAMGASARASLHARLAGAMERDPARRSQAAALAQHYAQAVALGTAPKAIDYSIAAGRDAVADLAFEDAVDHFRRALGLMETHAPGDRVQRVEVMIELAGALVFVDEAAGAQAALDAIDAARADGSAEQFARAVVVFVETAESVYSYQSRVAALLEEAQTVLGDRAPPLRARLMALEAFKYGGYQLWGGDGAALAVEAITIAREAGDVAALVEALHARAVNLEGTGDTAERFALGEELVALGRDNGPRGANATAFGRRVLASAYLEEGDADAVDAQIGELERVGTEHRWLPALVYATQWRVTQATMEGRFDAARTLLKEMRRYGRAYRSAPAIATQQLFFLAREEGALGTTVGPLAARAQDSQGLLVPAMLALAQVETDADADAAETVAALVTDDLSRRPEETSWGAELAMLAEAAASTGPPDPAAVLLRLLQPFSGRLLAVVVGLACLGAADRYLAMLHSRLEQWDDAAAAFDRAVALETRARAESCLLRTHYWQARMLARRGGEGDADAARVLARDIASAARRLSMARLADQAVRLQA